MLLRLGAWCLAPNVMFGAVFLVPTKTGESWAIGGLRAKAGLRISWRVINDIECFLEPGYAMDFSGGTFNGIVASCGVIFR
jgi:hypothetical protein